MIVVDEALSHGLKVALVDKAYAPIIIREVINAMTSRGHMDEIGKEIHIHPALPELIPATLHRLKEV